MVYIVTITTKEKLWTHHHENPEHNYDTQFATYQFTDGEAAVAFMETAAKHASDFISATMEYVIALDDRDF